MYTPGAAPFTPPLRRNNPIKDQAINALANLKLPPRTYVRGPADLPQADLPTQDNLRLNRPTQQTSVGVNRGGLARAWHTARISPA